MPANTNLSYSYQNQVRDLVATFNSLVAQAPVLLSLIPVAPYFAKSHTHEWLDDRLTPKQTALTAVSLAADGTLDVTDGTIFKVGDLWVNTETDEVVLVTAVAGNVVTATRGVSSDAEDMAIGHVMRLVSRPQDEGTDPGQDKGHEPTPVTNYTQIFDRTAIVTRTALNTAMYGIDDLLDREVKIQLDDLWREVNTTLIHGRKQKRTGTTATTKGRAGGIIEFLRQAGSNSIDAAGADVSRTLLNDSLEQAFNSGAGRLVAVCHPYQARKITAMDSNYEIVRENQTGGNVILRYQGDIANAKNTPSEIVVDPNYSKRRVDFLDVERLAMVWLANSALTDKDATPAGADYVARRILGEATFEVRNAKEAHCSVTQLG
jgi:hypothetical protein